MAAQTLTLTDFLLARIADEEAMAERIKPYLDAPGSQIEVRLSRTEDLADGSRRTISETVTPYHPARVLAECAAKREIVEDNRDCTWGCGNEPNCHDCITLGRLAAVYGDHPDFREEWRP